MFPENKNVHALNIPSKVPLPLFSSPPNKTNLERWANGHPTPRLRGIAHKIADNLNYISFEHFLKALQNVVTQFNAKIGNEPYVLLVQKINDKLASDDWTTSIALNQCGLKSPSIILTVDDLNGYLKQNPNIKNILILDDAMYSGTQKIRLMQDIESENVEIEHITLNIGIPFLTNYAKTRMQEHVQYYNQEHAQYYNKVDFMDHQIMPSMKDILGEEDFSFLSNLKCDSIEDGYTLTYFDHKVADSMSFFQPIYNGTSIIGSAVTSDLMLYLGYGYPNGKYSSASMIINNPDQYNKLTKELIDPLSTMRGANIPVVIEPYRLKNSMENLKYALENGLVGPRTIYAASKEIEAMLSTTPSPSYRPIIPIVSVTLSAEQQDDIDRNVSVKTLDQLNVEKAKEVEVDRFQENVKSSCFPRRRPGKP